MYEKIGSEVELPGIPNISSLSYADNVLYRDDSRPLAVIDAKCICLTPVKDR